MTQLEIILSIMSVVFVFAFLFQLWLISKYKNLCINFVSQISELKKIIERYKEIVDKYQQR